MWDSLSVLASDKYLQNVLDAFLLFITSIVDWQNKYCEDFIFVFTRWRQRSLAHFICDAVSLWLLHAVALCYSVRSVLNLVWPSQSLRHLSPTFVSFSTACSLESLDLFRSTSYFLRILILITVTWLGKMAVSVYERAAALLRSVSAAS